MSSDAPTRRVALVTGAGGGIGRGVTRALAEAGWRVAAAGRTLATLDETASDSPSILPLVMDVTDPASAAAGFAEVEARFGRLDFLFNNAGVSAAAAAPDALDPIAWRRVIDTNLTGAFLCTAAAFRLMKAQRPRGGRIVNNGSVSAHAPRPGSAAYTAAKHGVTGLTKAALLDGRAYDIVCGQIDIGNADTDMAASLRTGAAQADGSVAPEPVIDVALVARTVVYMADLPLEANVPFLTLMASGMPLYGRG